MHPCISALIHRPFLVHNSIPPSIFFLMCLSFLFLALAYWYMTHVFEQDFLSTQNLITLYYVGDPIFISLSSVSCLPTLLYILNHTVSHNIWKLLFSWKFLCFSYYRQEVQIVTAVYVHTSTYTVFVFQFIVPICIFIAFRVEQKHFSFLELFISMISK